MRQLSNKTFAAVCLIFGSICVSLTACTNDGDVQETKSTTLQVNLITQNKTRSVINSATLPDSSRYGVYVVPLDEKIGQGNNGFNIPVSYIGGKSTIGREFILNEGNQYNVFAAYPQENNSSTMTMYIDTKSQTDYLYGYATESNGEMAVISQDNYVANIRLHHMMALLRFQIFQGEENTEQNEITKVSLYENYNGATLDLQTGELTNYTFGQTDVDCYVNASTAPKIVEMLVLPSEISEQRLSFFVNGKSIEAVCNCKLEAGNSYTFNVEVKSDASLTISEATIISRENSTMEPLAVEILPIGGIVGKPIDLGLSVKWADHNIGASLPIERGGKYLWGDPTGTLTEKTASSYNKPLLNDISGTEYDIAKAQWGGKWRLPSITEVLELIDNTTFEWVTINEVEGVLLTSLKPGYTDKSVFFPWYGSKWSETGVKVGSVWTGTLWTDNYAYMFSYDEEVLNKKGGNITYEYPVRPVCE